MDVLEDRIFQVDTVRALHQTVVSLRAALEQSRLEIQELKERIWSTETCELTIQTLSVENHILRRKILSNQEFKENTTQTSIPYINVDNSDETSSKSESVITEIKVTPRKSDDTVKKEPKSVEFDDTVQEFSDDTSEKLKTPRKLVESPRSIVKSPTSQPETLETDQDSKEIVESLRKTEQNLLKTVANLRKTEESIQKTVASSRQTIDSLETSDSLRKTSDSPRQTNESLRQTVKSPRTTEQNGLKTVGNLRKTEEAIQKTVDSCRQTIDSLETSDSPRKTTDSPRQTVKSPRKTEQNVLKTVVNVRKTKEAKQKTVDSSKQTIDSLETSESPRKPEKTSKKSPRNKSIDSPHPKNDSTLTTPKITNALSPRQTLITVNVTLKSPKRNKRKHKQHDDSDTSDLNSTPSMDDNKEDSPSHPELGKGDDEIETEEVDDIELIFTTDETTTVIKEELVSIADGNDDCDTPILLNYKTVDFDTPDLHLSVDNMDKELEDDVFHETDNFENENTENLQITNSKSDNSINKNEVDFRDKSLKSCYSYQDSSFESRSLDKDESFDKFDDKEKYLHKMWSNNSVLVETDISKCGIVDPELPSLQNRRNTCPNPVPYRPIVHREALKHNSRAFVKFRNERPILNETNSPKTESEAQTDISALPNFWKSESYLAHKVQTQFTTLPSKFPMPISQKSLRLHEKTKEARRVLLSDINFTSMVPELSRSADHLYQENQDNVPTSYGQYLNTPGPQLLRRYNTGDSLTSPNFNHSQKFTWSPSDYSNFSSTKFDNSNTYLNRFRGSLNSFEEKRRSFSTGWRQNAPTSFDSTRAGHGVYRSVPNSPTRSRSVPFIYCPHFKHGKPYSGFRYLNGSLPELHVDDSGDSTDSLVEEAEQYLRSSIDCIVSGREVPQTHTKRRASAPCPTRDSSPPRNWQPFLPHGIKDLRSDNWVKVISPEGKIRGGRVRYVGYVLGQQDPFVGIELSSNVGNSDGSFNNRKYFECSPNHALFIPFKKVVMGWRN